MSKDAAETKPKFIPDGELRGRDNSGGNDKPSLERTAEFGDGGKVNGAKAALTPGG